MEKKTNIVVAGACGRMGIKITRATLVCKEAVFYGGYEKSGHEKIGQSIGVLANVNNWYCVVSDSLPDLLSKGEVDVVIDFTAPNASLETARAIRRHNSSVGNVNKVALVIGTTGFSEEQITEITEMCGEDVACVMSSNMSLGVNVLLGLVETASRALRFWDAEISEIHHKLKKDAPSGTAKMIGKAIAAGLGSSFHFGQNAVYGRGPESGQRTNSEIGVHSLRGGTVAGEHTVHFFGNSERIEITHKAEDPSIFAEGAVAAALWVAGKPAGLYGMKDVLGL